MRLSKGGPAAARTRHRTIRIADITHRSIRDLANTEDGGTVTVEGILNGSTLTVTWAKAK